MTQTPLSVRLTTAELLQKSTQKIGTLSCLVGFDGFVDEITRIVDKRQSSCNYTAIPTITAFAERIRKAAGKSTNIEMAVQQIKLGGNGPIVANALATFGLQTTCIGSLGYPELHPVFRDLSSRAHIYSIAEPAVTLALEFEDGKIMLGQSDSLQEMTYENIVKVVGEKQFQQLWKQSHVISINNWTMLVSMTELWQKILQHHCSDSMLDRQNIIYFDLADPEKRTQEDIFEGLETLARFQPFFQIFLCCNEKESVEISQTLQIAPGDSGREALQSRAQRIRERLQIDGVVIHPLKYAVAATVKDTACVDGPYVANPRISTGAGDHFNAGFCLASALDFGLESALLTGVATSGYYVRNAASPTVNNIIAFLEGWK